MIRQITQARAHSAGAAKGQHLHHGFAIVGVGPVVQARQAIFADGDSAGAAVARQHQSARHIGHPRACALEVFARQPRDRSCYQAWVGLWEHAERSVTTAISREQLKYGN